MNGAQWRFNIGKANVDIRGPNDVKHVVSKWEMLGISEQSWRSIDPRDRPGIGPGDIRSFIERLR